MREFIKCWILAGSVYIAQIFFMMAYLLRPEFFVIPWLAFLCGLAGALFSFYACCAVDNLRYKQFLGRYIPLLFVYGAVALYCGIDPVIVLLPFLLCQCFFFAASLYVVFREWQFSATLKNVAGIILGGQAAAQLFYEYSVLADFPGMAEIFANMVFLILLNFMFSLFYEKTIMQKDSLEKEYLHIMVENAVDILFYYTYTPHQRFTYISPSVESIVGYTQDEFYRNSKLHLEITHEEDREIMEEAFSSNAFSVNKNYVKWQKKDGDFVYLEFHNNPIYAGTELLAVEGILRDVTDRVLAEKRMADAQKSRQLLLSYISHELKTPITYITGYAELLQGDFLESEEERKKASGLILSKAVFLQNLVNDLFQLSKMESNQYSFEFMQMEIKELYGILEEEYKNDIYNTGIKSTMSISEELWENKYEVLVDVKRIRQVYANLLQNAIKHTPREERIDCKCWLDEQKKNVLFEIADTGEGIDREDLPNIFKAFYKGKKGSKKQESSGLGLSLCEQIISAHRGEIKVQLKRQGSVFCFSLPLYMEEI